jgi:hypothetical protein
VSTIAVATLAAFAAYPAYAQQEPPPPPDAADAAPAPPPGSSATAQDADPPGRVARLNYMAGTVTTQPAGADDWSYAQVNRPLTTGDQLWNDKGARSELHIGSTAVRLGATTSVDVLNLDDDSTQLKVAQGTLSTRVRELPSGTAYEIDTPNLALGIGGPGDYRVDVAPDGSSTTVTVRSGSATVYGDGNQLPVAAGQQVRFAGTNLQQLASSGAPAPDSLDQWAASRDAAEDRSVSARYVSRDMPGYQDLDANGAWRQDPQYGAVWTPNQMPADWAPYRDGHWIWQAPWGWTWVDDAPWGFAPYHYGRWAYIGNSWAWVPGEDVASAPPVYAPALVAFVDDGGNAGGGVDWGVSLAVGGVATAGLAWFALGPGEPWHPHWAHGWSPRYYERVNRPVYVRNSVTNIHNTYVNYRAPHAVTCVPATAFVHGQPVNRFAQRINPQQWHNARFNAGAPGIAPVQQSFRPGVREAAYRPPAAAIARPVVATRRPDVPAAWHDQLAQHFAQGGGRVPGAGNPVVHTAVPAHFGGQRIGSAGVPTQNVRLVQARAPATAAGAVRSATMGPQQVPGMAPAGTPRGAMNAAPSAGGAGQARPGEGRAPAGSPERPQQAGNGVPRPPQFAGGNHPNYGALPAGAQNGARPGAPSGGQPVWTQPHTPMAQQRQGGEQQPFAQRAPGGGNPAADGQQRPGFNPADAQHAVPRAHQPMPAQQTEPRAPQGQPVPQQAQQPRPEFHPQQVQQPQQPRSEPPRQVQQPQQPRPEFHPQQAQQPRPEFHPQQAPEPRPQQAQQPRPEFHPQPAPQPRPQVQQQPRPQQQSQHQEQRGGGGRDEHHRG